MPFTWNYIYKNGKLFGDSLNNSNFSLTNNKIFSYPGYNEILTGNADSTIKSNAKIYNKNVTVLEKTLTISKDRITRASYQFEYGQGTMLNVLNAQVDINNDSINLINAKQQLVNTKRDLNVVLGNVISSESRVDTTIDFKYWSERLS